MMGPETGCGPSGSSRDPPGGHRDYVRLRVGDGLLGRHNGLRRCFLSGDSGQIQE